MGTHGISMHSLSPAMGTHTHTHTHTHTLTRTLTTDTEFTTIMTEYLSVLLITFILLRGQNSSFTVSDEMTRVSDSQLVYNGAGQECDM